MSYLCPKIWDYVSRCYKNSSLLTNQGVLFIAINKHAFLPMRNSYYIMGNFIWMNDMGWDFLTFAIPAPSTS